jgi:hypothetical protein
MKENFTITSPSVKIILLIFIGILIIVRGFDVAHNIGVHRLIEGTNIKPFSTVLINQVKYYSVSNVETAKIDYIVQGPLEYLLLNAGRSKESLVVLLLEMVIGVLSWLFLWKFDFANPFKPDSFIRSYTIFRFVIALFLVDYLAYIYSDYCMRGYFHSDNFNYVNSPNGGYWVQILIAIVIMYMYGNAVKNKEELNLTI